MTAWTTSTWKTRKFLRYVPPHYIHHWLNNFSSSATWFYFCQVNASLPRVPLNRFQHKILLHCSHKQQQLEKRYIRLGTSINHLQHYDRIQHFSALSEATLGHVNWGVVYQESSSPSIIDPYKITFKKRFESKTFA